MDLWDSSDIKNEYSFATVFVTLNKFEPADIKYPYRYNHGMYKIFNIALDSQLHIPELEQVSNSTEKDIYTFKLLEKIDVDDTNIDWFHDCLDPNGIIILSAGRNEGGYWLRFPQLVDFEINLNEQSINAYSIPGTTQTTVRHLLLDQVIPRMLGQRGKLILHAGAVRLLNGKAVAFIGQSGWGKSTLVSSFHQHGCELITDDCLMIDLENESVSVIPNYYGIRLFDDSIDAIFSDYQHVEDVAHYSSKRRLNLSNSRKSEGRKDASPIQLDTIFLLSDPKNDKSSHQITFRSAGGMDAMMTLVAQVFVLDVSDKDLMAKQFKHCGKIFDSDISCYEIDYPRKHDKLGDVREAIESVLQEGES